MKQNRLVPTLRFREFEGPWAEKYLGDIFVINAGGDIDNKHVSKVKTDVYQYPIYANAEKKRGFYAYSDIYKVEAGTITIAGRGVNIGIAHARDHRFYPIVRLLVLTPKNNENIYFGEYAINRINLFVESTGVPQLTVPQVSNYQIALPSLPEQKKIASFLSALDEKTQLLTCKKGLLEQYKKGVMQQLFSGKLRFKDEKGKDYPDWEKKTLGDVAEKVFSKNKTNTVNYVLTNSATQGVVAQEDYFDRGIANQNNLEGYYIVSVDDFVYNPRISVHAPVGPIKRNKLREGVMSPLYSIFRFKENHLEYFEFFFETTAWHEYLESIANIGARHDRMNITTGDFFKMPIPFPCENERKKIAEFLIKISAKISATERTLNETQTFKRGLLQQMFV